MIQIASWCDIHYVHTTAATDEVSKDNYLRSGIGWSRLSTHYRPINIWSALLSCMRTKHAYTMAAPLCGRHPAAYKHNVGTHGLMLFTL